MKYAVERASGGMIYLLSFMKINSDVQKLLGGTHMQTHTHTHTPQKAVLAWLDICLHFGEYKVIARRADRVTSFFCSSDLLLTVSCVIARPNVEISFAIFSVTRLRNFTESCLWIEQRQKVKRKQLF
jgi:hypothetical protein